MPPRSLPDRMRTLAHAIEFGQHRAHVRLDSRLRGDERISENLISMAGHRFASTAREPRPASLRARSERPSIRRYRLHNLAVLAYIEEHLADAITVTDLANVACLSIFHFARAFTATMGVPPHRYVSGRRLENAKTMIATGHVSLSEIAFNCQFSSQSSFTRAFLRATGMTPAEYRRTLRHRAPEPGSLPTPGSSECRHSCLSRLYHEAADGRGWSRPLHPRRTFANAVPLRSSFGSRFRSRARTSGERGHYDRLAK